MRRTPIRADSAEKGDLIITVNNVRMRVDWVRHVEEDTVIIIGHSAQGPVGIPHARDRQIIRLD